MVKVIEEADLNVMLHEGVEGFPAKAFRQLLRPDRSIAELKLVKDPLEGQGHAPLSVVALRRHLVHRLPQLPSPKTRNQN